MALLYAAASPEADLVAVTCVGGNVDARQVERNTRAVLELAGRGDVEVALGDEQPLVRPVETTPETHGPQGLGYAELPLATTAPERPPRRRRLDRPRPREARRDHAGDARPADEPRPGAAARAGPATPASAVGAHGRRLSRPGQHRPDDRVEHPLRPGGRADRLRSQRGRRCPLALGLDVTEKAKITPDHVVALARRAGSTPDDSIALSRGEDPMHAERSVALEPDRPVHRRRAALLHGVPLALRRVLRRIHPRPARGGRRARPDAGPDGGARRRRRAEPGSSRPARP